MQNRSISQEVITIIQKYLNSSQIPQINATLEFLSLEGAWKDERKAEDIIKEIKKGRNKSNRFGARKSIHLHNLINCNIRVK
jgi:hypothetical protein